VRISLRDGRELAAELDHQRGGSENPMTAAEVIDKFRTNAALAIGDDDLATLEQAILGLGAGTELAALSTLRGAALAAPQPA
jgi:hypothetical protein